MSAGPAGNTLCGGTVVTDGAWHHVAVTRQKSTGRLRIYVDGVLDAQGTAASGTQGRVLPGRAADLRAGLRPVPRHRRGEARRRTRYPSYRGWIDEVRLSTELIHGGRFTRPFSPFSPSREHRGALPS